MEMVLDRYHLFGFFNSSGNVSRQEGYVVVVPKTGKLTGIVTDSSHKGNHPVVSNIIGICYPGKGVIDLLKVPREGFHESAIYWHLEKDQLQGDLDQKEGEYLGGWQKLSLPRSLNATLRNPEITLYNSSLLSQTYLKSHLFTSKMINRFRQNHRPSNTGGIELTLINKSVRHSIDVPIGDLLGKLRSPMPIR